MIRSVKIPTTVSRMGCTPGGDCCDSCRSHTGPPEGPPATHTHSIPSVRNSALYSTLRDVQCDPDGNCWTDGVLTSAPLTTGPGCPVGVMNCGGMSTGGYIALGAIGLVALLMKPFGGRGR